MTTQLLALADTTWLTVWKVVAVATSCIFAVMVVVVSVRAVGDLRFLLHDLSVKSSEPDDTARHRDPDG